MEEELKKRLDDLEKKIIKKIEYLEGIIVALKTGDWKI